MLRALVARGLSRKEICQAMNRSRFAIDKWMAELGLSTKNVLGGGRRRWTDEETLRAIEFKQAGLSLPKIAAQMGRHPETIRLALKRAHEIGLYIERRKERIVVQLPQCAAIKEDSFIRPPTRAQLMAGR